jgi:hypothetical protein
MGRFDNLAEIRRLDPVADHCRIVHLTNGYEFPWDCTRSLEMALYRTYCVPSISKLLDETGQFRLYTQKRYDDTALIVAEILKNGYDSERGREALRRMNRIHAHFRISNEDYLYVLSTFVFEPLRWLERFGWRKPDPNEKLAHYYFWREVGRRMNIKDIPASYEAFETYNREYEQANFHYAASNKAVGSATRNLFIGWYPRYLSPAIEFGIYAMLEERLLEAFGFPRPPAVLRLAVAGGLKLRGKIFRFFPVRRKPGFLTEGRPYTYPNGYKIADLGPAHMQAELNNPRPAQNPATLD